MPHDETHPEVSRMSVREFNALGLLQELNRRFLHPLGLALEVVRDQETGEERFGQVWDYRGAPAGLSFADGLEPGPALAVDALLRAHRAARLEQFHTMVQPITGLAEARLKATAPPRAKGKRPRLVLDVAGSPDGAMLIDEGGAQEVSLEVDGITVWSMEPTVDWPENGARVALTITRKDMTDAEVQAVPEV